MDNSFAPRPGQESHTSGLPPVSGQDSATSSP